MAKKWGLDAVYITLGCLAMAAGLSLFFSPNGIAPGGVSGLAIILNTVVPLTVGVWIILIFIPLLIVAYANFGLKFILSTGFAIVVYSFFTELLSLIVLPVSDLVLASVYGGILFGAGMGIVFSRGSTTGGTDILIRLIKRKKPQIRLGRMVLYIDIVIIALSALVFFDFTRALYAIIAIYVTSLVIDTVIYGTDSAHVAYIIADNPDEISHRITNDLSRGATILKGEGGYTKQEKEVIMCAVKRQEVALLHQIIDEIGQNAFVIFIKASEVYGMGFRKYKDDL